jgi:hypothetical protein
MKAADSRAGDQRLANEAAHAPAQVIQQTPALDRSRVLPLFLWRPLPILDLAS